MMKGEETNAKDDSQNDRIDDRFFPRHGLARSLLEKFGNGRKILLGGPVAVLFAGFSFELFFGSLDVFWNIPFVLGLALSDGSAHGDGTTSVM